MPKGGSYEREVCRQLSRWWSGNPDTDDLFWRASQSGGRATVRARQGKTTRGHCGDVAATCGDADPLTGVVTVEVKRGYNHITPVDFLDCDQHFKTPKDKRRQRFYDFVSQARGAAIRARTKYWMLIHKRDSRHAMVYLPRGLADSVLGDQVRSVVELPRLRIVGMRLEKFLHHADPALFRKLYRRLQNGRGDP